MRSGSYNYFFADLCTKSPEQKPSPPIHELGRCFKQERLNDPPQLDIPCRATPKVIRKLELFEILIHGIRLMVF